MGRQQQQQQNLQVVAEWMAGLIKGGNTHVAAISPVWSADLNTPAEVCEFTVTLAEGERFNVAVTRTTDETEIREF